ncbi:MAG: hypothetical protein FJ146_18750 [Deltaproteobacteria bacterium]|nr:hypothetical protein [Deltaproteobacteria bacterium]
MVARFQVDRTLLLVNHDDFRQRVGLIENYYELSKLGFPLNNLSGIFRPADLSELVEFCQSNARYHIVSYLGEGHYKNKLVPHAKSFALANGDNDPSIALNDLLDPELPVIDEDTISEALAVLDYIKNRS